MLRMRSIVLVPTVVALTLVTMGAGRAGSARIPPTADPAAGRYCANPGTPQVVRGITVVAVCVINYQYVPGDDDAAPCAGFVAGSPASTCVSGPRLRAPKLEIPQGARLLFDVPDPNMHTLTSIDCPNRFVDPPSPDPLGAFNLVLRTAEQGLFGPDRIATGKGRCAFDTYPVNGGSAARPGSGDLTGPAYETVDTSHLRPGTYSFYCQVHAYMRGTLIVDRTR
ncbi:MAG: hypothetical protein ACYDD7_12440 [Acidimicrobiales bacterium]